MYKAKGKRTTWKDSWPLCSSGLRSSQRDHPLSLKRFRRSVNLPWQQLQGRKILPNFKISHCNICPRSLNQSAIQLQLCFRLRGASLSFLLKTDHSELIWFRKEEVLIQRVLYSWHLLRPYCHTLAFENVFIEEVGRPKMNPAREFTLVDNSN